jgi:hypothetical protein
VHHSTMVEVAVAVEAVLAVVKSANSLGRKVVGSCVEFGRESVKLPLQLESLG